MRHLTPSSPSGPARAMPALWALVLAAWFGLVLAPGQAAAHAQLHGSDPAEGSMLAAFPDQITLTFSEGVAPLMLRWIAPDGSATEAEGLAEDHRLTIPAPRDSGEGTYLLSWRVTSADGHPVGGVVTLHLGSTSAQAGVTGGEGAARATVLARFLLSASLIAAVGAALHGALIARRPPASGLRGFGRIAAAAALIFALALTGLHGLNLLSLPLSALALAEPWQAGLAAPLARTAGLSALAALLAALALNGAGPRGPLALGAWAFSALSFAASGHAVTAPPRLLSTLAMVLHGAALVWWLGLLVPLLMDLRRPEATRHLTRFSSIALPLVALLSLSGLWLIWAQTGGDLALLAQSAWGVLLGIKLLAVAALLALAALNRWRLTPALVLTGRAAPLGRSIRAEVALGLLVLALAAGFQLTPPPRALGTPEAPLLAHLHGSRAMADLRVSPGRAGPVILEMAFQTGDFEPLEPLEVAVALTPADGQLEPIRAQATLAEDQIWRTTPVTLPYGGDWEVAITLLITDFESTVLRETLSLRDR